MRIAIIGGGPSGLVTLKYLVHAHRVLGKPPVEATLFERETGVGGAFRVRVYEDAEVGISSQCRNLVLTVYILPARVIETTNDVF
jgi:dimethylaniline monooxygenase (N-oxide forming)